MNTDVEHGVDGDRSGRGVWHRASTLASVSVVVGALAWWGVYGASSRVWLADVLLNGTAYALVAGWGVLGGAVLVRRGKIEVLGFVGLVAVTAALLGGRAVLQTGNSDRVGFDQESVSLVTMNIYMANQEPEQVLELIRSFEDDVVVLVEPQWDVFRRFLDGTDGADQFEHRILRRKIENEAAPMVILSRWDIERDEGIDDILGLSGVILRPVERGGPFELTGIHIRSPRSQAKWSRGNEELDDLISSLGSRDRAGSMQRVVLGDLNGGPSTTRDRRLSRGLNLVRGSSMFGLTGTFPAKLSIFGAGIDDIWVSEGFDVLSWESMEIPGSDHRGVRVVIR